MKFSNGNVVIYNNNVGYYLNIVDIIDKFQTKELKTNNSITEYAILDDIFIDSIRNNKLEVNKIESISIKPFENDIPHLNLNDDLNYFSDVVCYNIKTKKFFSSPITTLENKFIVQNNSNLVYPHINFIDNLHLNSSFGYLVGYWLLRGGFFKMDKEYPSWSGRESDILRLKNTLTEQTNLTKSFKEKLQLLLLIEDEYFSFFKTHFFSGKFKVLPPWLLIAKQDFIQGLFYGLIASNSYISSDSKGNYYLAIKVSNPNIITQLHNLFKFRFNIYSRIIGENNHLSFKFNKKLHEFVSNGINKKYIDIEMFESIEPIINKEIIINSFKMIPWYKFKTPQLNDTIKTVASITLEKPAPHMFSNGIFTSN